MKRAITIKNIKGVLLALSCSVVLFSCSKWDDFKDYTKDGEILYSGKMDSVSILPGKERVKFTGTFNADPKVVKYKIFWNDFADSLEFQKESQQSGGGTVEEIIEMEEGVHSFVIYTYDAEGNSSVPVNAVGASYGDAYRRKLSNRLVSGIKYELERTILYWDPMDPTIGPQFTEIEYEYNGQDYAINIPINVDSTILDGVNKPISFKYRTIFKPAPNSIDTFAVAFADYLIPGEPVITSVAPATGPVGQSVTIAGKNFGEDLAKINIKVNGVDANVTSLTDEQIVFEVPQTTRGFIVMEVGNRTYDVGYFNMPRVEGYENAITHLLFDGNGADASADVEAGRDNPATLVGGATYGASLMDQGLVLNGSGDSHAKLPDAIINVDSLTISCYVKVNSLANWTRLWDFGTGTNAYAFLSVQNGATGVPRFAIKNGGPEQLIDSDAGALDIGKWYHIAITYKNKVGIMYIDGEEVGRNENMTIKPSDLGNTNQNYIGKAQFPDPLLNGVVDDFRIYQDALSPEEINDLR